MFIVSLFIFAVSFSAFAQEFNSKLLVKYDASELTNLKQNAPHQLELLNYYVNDACYFVDMPDKPIEFHELQKIDPQTGEVNYDHVITSNDLIDFNPLEYNCEFNDMFSGYYKVGNTGKLLIIPSSADFEIAIANEEKINNIK